VSRSLASDEEVEAPTEKPMASARQLKRLTRFIDASANIDDLVQSESLSDLLKRALVIYRRAKRLLRKQEAIGAKAPLHQTSEKYIDRYTLEVNRLVKELMWAKPAVMKLAALVAALQIQVRYKTNVEDAVVTEGRGSVGDVLDEAEEILHIALSGCSRLMKAQRQAEGTRDAFQSRNHQTYNTFLNAWRVRDMSEGDEKNIGKAESLDSEAVRFANYHEPNANASDSEFDSEDTASNDDDENANVNEDEDADDDDADDADEDADDEADDDEEQ
jgi:hypothetical protein